MLLVLALAAVAAVSLRAQALEHGARCPDFIEGLFAHIAGEDLVQGQDGQWWVLEDNLRIPSGASYPLFARDIERRITPSLFRNVRVRDNRDYPRLLRQSMDFVSTDGIAVVLTPGRYNSAFFEHAYLAEKTGAALTMANRILGVVVQVTVHRPDAAPVEVNIKLWLRQLKRGTRAYRNVMESARELKGVFDEMIAGQGNG